MKKTVRVSADLLPAPLRMRFDVLFNIARTRSIVQWETVAPIAADVMVSDRSTEVRANAVAMVIGDMPRHAHSAQSVRLETSYGVASLIAALDLAAVRVLNLRDFHSKSMPEKIDDASTFRLKHWVTLDSAMASSAHSRALAAMTRKAVTRDWIVKNCDLSAVQIDALLNALRQKDVLHICAKEMHDVASAGTAVGDPPSVPGFVGRLKRWLSGARSTALPTKPHTP